MVLSFREKALIGVLTALVLVAGVLFAQRALQAYEQDMRLEISRLETLVNEARLANEELEQLRRSPARTAPRSSLIGYVERLAEGINLKDRVQLNLLPQDSKAGVQGLEIRVNNANLDEFVNLVYAVENSEPVMVVDQMELAPAFREKDLLRISLRVLARN